MTTQNMSYRQVKYQLFQDADGFWGWIIGNKTMLASFSYRSSAISAAKRHIDNTK